MAGTSDNYNLTLPELEDKITDSIPQIAENFSEIDRVMKANEEKINTDIANTAAEFDSKLNTAKNKLTADLQSTQKQLEEGIEVATKAIFGTYTGNATRGRIINLGFKPVLVLVFPADRPMESSAAQYWGIASSGYTISSGASETLRCTITETGFTVTYNTASRTNESGILYCFIAFKNGEFKVVS